MKPLLSIVIANYNYGRFLEEAIQSVLRQNMGEKVELIIVDGGSSDNSVEIIKKYENELAWWCSEPDGGQSDAFNKGFSHAKGKYLTWLNADDMMVGGCLKKVCASLAKHPNCEWFTANFFRFTQDGKIIEVAWGPHFLPKFLQTRHQPLAVYGPSTFFAKELFERMGGMKVYQHFMMDTDLWMRFIVAGVKQRRINCFCWAFRMHEDSKTAEYGDHKLKTEEREKFERERQRAIEETVYRENVPNAVVVKLWRLLDASFFRQLYIKKNMKSMRDL